MQSKRMSFVEAITKPLIMNIVAVLMWSYVFAPLYGFKLPVYESAAISVFFFLTSVLLGYIIRRVFNLLEKSNED